MIMPVEMQVLYEDGSTEALHFPAEIWFKKKTWTHTLATNKPIQRVVIDPRGMLPDTDRKNNSWESGGK